MPESPPQSAPDLSKVYEAIWQTMDRENRLINDRNQWAILLSGGILATEAALMGAIHSPINTFEDNFAPGGVLLLMGILSSLALYFCHRSSQGVLAAQNQLDYLKREYKKFGDGDENRFQTELKLPRPFGNPHDHYRGNATAVTFPKVMFVFWFIFATLQFVGAVVYLSDGMRGIFRAIHVSEKHNTEGVNNVAGIPAVISGKVPPVIVAPMPSPPPPSAAKPKKPKQSRQR